MGQKNNHLIDFEEDKTKTNPAKIQEEVNDKSNVKIKKIRITVKTINSIEILLA